MKLDRLRMIPSKKSKKKQRMLARKLKKQRHRERKRISNAANISSDTQGITRKSLRSATAMQNQNRANKNSERLSKRRSKSLGSDSDCVIVDNITDFIVLDEDNDRSDQSNAAGAATNSDDVPSDDIFYEDRNPMNSIPNETTSKPPAYDIYLQPLIGDTKVPVTSASTNSKRKPADNAGVTSIKRTVVNDRCSNLNESVLSSQRQSELNDSVSDVSFSQSDETLPTNSISAIVSSTPIGAKSVNNQMNEPSSSNASSLQKTVKNRTGPLSKRTHMDSSGSPSNSITQATFNTIHNNGSGDSSPSATLRKTNETIVSNTVSLKVTIQNDKQKEKQTNTEDDSIVLVPDVTADDSVIFVSETQHTSRINPAVRFFGANYIRLPPQEYPSISVRAKRSAEKRKRKSILGVNKQQCIQKNVKKVNLAKIRRNVKDFLCDLNGKKSQEKSSDSEARENKTQESDGVLEKRMIIIDGNNVAYGHGQTQFSVKGLELCIQYFEEKGFDVKAVCPQMRLQKNRSTDPKRLEEMVKLKKVILTPCKNLQGKKATSYDDRFILEIASDFDAAIISNDNYKDLLDQNSQWDEIIKTRVIGYTWCIDKLYLPQDPYGKTGPTLQQVLHKASASSEESSSTP